MSWSGVVCFLDRTTILVLLGCLWILSLLYHRYRMYRARSIIAQLQAVVETRGIFMNVVSHELRNPMTTIYASMDLLQHYSERLQEAEKQEIFENIRKSILRMTRMMDRMVLVGRLQHKQIAYAPQCTDILMLCSSIIDGLSDKNARQRIQIICSTTQPPRITLDPVLVEYILGNLLGNALKYSPENVLLVLKTEQNTIQFDVMDHGIGIPAEEVTKLSQLFGRCSNTGRAQGIGIGMYLAVRCVALHQGKLSVATALNHGTHFRLTLPHHETNPAR